MVDRKANETSTVCICAERCYLFPVSKLAWELRFWDSSCGCRPTGPHIKFELLLVIGLRIGWTKFESKICEGGMLHAYEHIQLKLLGTEELPMNQNDVRRVRDL